MMMDANVNVLLENSLLMLEKSMLESYS